MFLRILLNVKSRHTPAMSLRNCKKVRNVQNTVKLGYLVLISVHYGEAIKINFNVFPAINSIEFTVQTVGCICTTTIIVFTTSIFIVCWLFIAYGYMLIGQL